MWIYKGKIDITNLNRDLVVGNIWNDLIFNKYMQKSGFRLCNDGISFSLLHLDTYILHNKPYKDPIRVENSYVNIKNEEYCLLPDKSVIESISLDQLIKDLNLDRDKIYDLKTDLLNKFIKVC